MQSSKITKVVLVDDHKLVRKGILEIIRDFTGYEVIWEAVNGKDFTQKLSPQNLPDIVLLDIKMPLMNGYETAQWLEQRYPEIKVLALSMYDDEETILNMLKCGINGYLLKDSEPKDLKAALEALEQEGSYYSARVMEIIIKNLNKEPVLKLSLTDREIEFLRLACTELPYKSFAPILQIKPRTVEDTREKLFRKLEVGSRVGLVLYAIKHEIFKIK